MAALNFVDSHNMVAYLERPTDSDDFTKIVDFLNANPRRYALTINPTIYVSCIEKFWYTANAQTINEETQIHALVDGKKIVITESSVRRDLQFTNEDGTDCLPTTTIFENLKLMGIGKDFSGKVTPLFDTMLIQHQSEEGDNLERVATTASSLEAEQVVVLGAKTMGDTIARTGFKNVSKVSYDLPLGGVNTPQSDEDSMQLKESMEMCTNLLQRVQDLETIKTTQSKKITSLKKRVKKLEQRGRSRTPGLKRLYKVVTSRRVKSSAKASLDDQEDASKKGRNIAEIDADVDISLVHEDVGIQGRFDDEDMFDTSVFNDEEVFAGQDMADQEVNVAEKEVSVVDLVTTAGEVVTTASVDISTASVLITVSTATPTTPPTTTTEDDMTLAETLMEINSAKPKAI
ncbi:hypothetical protein Tco_0974209 [Tanacetum coccineum]|uniref:Xylulose kinase-1 n=1 Tax=Tanacetum coccineum TaxID=301880 RepID=A0ABQ5EAY8_9ASTR